MCIYRHWRNPIKVGDYLVLVSSLEGYESNRERSSPDPDFGVYLDEGWSSVEIGYPHQLYFWPNRGAIELPKFASIVDAIIEKVKEGEMVDIGCMEGHGRTGTVLAGLMMKLENLSAQEAITAVQERHCPDAIEADIQKQLLFEFGNTLLNVTKDNNVKNP
jgi:protein-tyrosine phosphatase